MGKKKGDGDPLEKLGALIDERIKAAFDGRDQAEREKSDPAARIEGIIDRAVAKQFAEFRRGLEDAGGEEEEPGGGGKAKAKPEAQPAGFWESLGLTSGD